MRGSPAQSKSLIGRAAALDGLLKPFVKIWAEDWSQVEHYCLGSSTAEFLICRRCGVYIGAIGETAAGTRAVISIIYLDDRAAFTRQPTLVDHDGEATEDRLARRAINWTPATLHRRRLSILADLPARSS